MKKIAVSLIVFLFQSSLFAQVDSMEVSENIPELTIEATTSDTQLTADVVDSTVENTLTDSFPPIEKMPELVTFVEAQYPEDLVKKGVEGTVTLELLVNESGYVDSVNLIKGIEPQLDNNAMEASKRFKFSPAVADGEPVAVLLQYEYRFSINETVDSIADIINFSGTLLEKGTRTPISDAIVIAAFSDSSSDTSLPLPFGHYIKKIGAIEGQHLDEDKIVTESDSQGKFSFYSLPACSIEITVIIPGYNVFKTKETISKTEEIVARYYIQRQSYSDYEIVVYGKAEEKEVSRRQLSIQEVRKIPGLGGDAIKVIQAMPGVARPTLGMGQVIVRGSPSWDSRYFLDGVQLPQLYHFGGLKSVYNSEALESIDFYPGGFGTRYGGAVGGVIEINGRKPKSDRIHGQVDISNVDGSLFLEGPVNEKVSVLVSGRRSFIGEFISLATKLAKDQFPATVSPFYWDYLARTDFNFSKNNHLYFSLFGSRDSMALIFPDMRAGSEEIDEARDRMGMNITFHTAITGWDLSLSQRWKNSLRLSLMYARSDMSIFGIVRQNENDLGFHFRDQLTYKLNDQLSFNTGIDAELVLVDLALVIPGSKDIFIKDTTENWLFGIVGAYLNLEWKPSERLQLIPGIRYDHFPELAYKGSIAPEFWNYQKFNNDRGYSGEPSLRINGRYNLNDNHTLKAAIGNYSQTPQPLGQVIHEVWGEPSLHATKAAHYVTGYEWQVTDLINSDIQFYYNKQWDIPEFAQENDVENDYRKLWVSNGKGRMYGMELMLRHLQSEKFFGWISYSLSRSERYDREEKKWVVYNKDQTHNVQVLGSWHLKKNYDLGFRMRYVTGDPKTPVIYAIEDENFGYFKPQPGKTNSSRMDPFFQLDLRMDKKFIHSKWIHSFYVDLQNISWFFYKSPEMEIYNYDYTDKTTFSMFPMLATGMKAEF